MKFKKLDERTICCMLSQEDLEDNGITVDDFIHNREKVQPFLEDIIETAKEEVGFEASGQMLSIQIMGMYPEGLMITVTEDTKDLTKLMKAGLAGMKGELEDDGWIQSDYDRQKIKDLLYELEKAAKRLGGELEEENKEEEQLGLLIFRFANLQNVLLFAKHVPVRSGLESSLYKNSEDNSYYMVLSKKRISEERYRTVLCTAIEYGENLGGSSVQQAYIQEHFDCLIPQRAVNSLKKIWKSSCKHDFANGNMA